MAVDEEQPLIRTDGGEASEQSAPRRPKAGWFSRLCHYCGFYSCRTLGNIFMLVALVTFEVFEVFAFYNVGVFNWYPILMNLAAFPGIVGIAVMKEYMLKHGVKEHGFQPEHSAFTVIAWALMAISFVICISVPFYLRGHEVLNTSWMWYSILGSVCLFTSFLFGFFCEAMAIKLKDSVQDKP